MSSTSSTTHSSRLRTVAGLAMWLAGCAATATADRSSAPSESARPPVESASAPESPRPAAPVLTLEYGNLSTRATFQVDLSGSDVHVELTGRSAKSDTFRSAPASAPRYATENVQRMEDAVSTRARALADSALRPMGAAPDSVTARVVAAIRRAQESFYQGRYAEASELARLAISIRPTAEAHALAGSISWVRKDREDARLHWLRARDLDPAYPGLANVLDSLLPLENRR